MVLYAKDGYCGGPPGGILATQLWAKHAGCTEAVDSSQASCQRSTPTIDQNIASVLECMTGLAQDNVDLQGSVIPKLALSPDGSVFLAGIQASSLPVPSVRQSLVKSAAFSFLSRRSFVRHFGPALSQLGGLALSGFE